MSEGHRGHLFLGSRALRLETRVTRRRLFALCSTVDTRFRRLVYINSIVHYLHIGTINAKIILVSAQSPLRPSSETFRHT